MTWDLVRRENGLVELACEHGVGHPSELLTPKKCYYGVHGCCGCCQKFSASFRLAERDYSTGAILKGCPELH